MVCRIVLVVLAWSFSIPNSFSQSLASISGKISDAKTKEPLPGAAVYLANTTIGAVANTDGTFSLHNIHPGKYDLTTSMIGYAQFSKPVIIEGKPLTGFDILLASKTEELNPLEVSAKRSNRKTDFAEFKKLFLGQTENSSHCTIVNIHDIFVYKDGTTLHALSHKPIEVVNYALGYRIFFDLKEFAIDYFYNRAVMSGIPRFEEMTPESPRQKERWDRERDRAYYGSPEHFFRSLKKRALKDNYFKTSDPKDHEISLDSLLKNSGDSVIHFKGNLKVVFNHERPEYFYNLKSNVQVSTLRFGTGQTKIYDNGYYGLQDILLSGYMGWSCRIADMVPLGYQPITKLK